MNPSMMKKLKKMQDEMTKAQEELESKEYFGKSSGVQVIMLGTKQVIDIKIDEEFLEELEMLEDSLALAFNDAVRQIDEEQQRVMGKFTGGMGGFGF